MQVANRTNRMTRAVALVTALVIGAAWGCGSDSPTGTDPDPDPDGEPTQENEIAVDDNFFDPLTTTVDAETQMTWVWRGGEGHNVTWDDGELPNSVTQVSGTHQVTMPSAAGEYGYHCTIHGTAGSGMHGTVIVD